MRTALILASAALLAACNSEPEVKMENASVGEVAEEMRKLAEKIGLKIEARADG